jgi:hypothetical protein
MERGRWQVAIFALAGMGGDAVVNVFHFLGIYHRPQPSHTPHIWLLPLASQAGITLSTEIMGGGGVSFVVYRALLVFTLSIFDGPP